MKRFVMYRRGDISATHNEDQRNPPNEPQFEGVEFSDGKVVFHWCTGVKSISVWDSMEDLLKIHGHPEYDSELKWLDIDWLRDVLRDTKFLSLDEYQKLENIKKFSKVL